MKEPAPEKRNVKKKQMTIDGHKITISFAQECNPALSSLVRNTLPDDYIRKNGLSAETQSA